MPCVELRITHSYMRYMVTTAVHIDCMDLWSATPCSAVNVTLKIEALDSFDMLTYIY
jgi:hypothetical protein